MKEISQINATYTIEEIGLVETTGTNLQNLF